MKIVIFEGVDGAGKSETVKLLYNYLININKKVLIVREPGGTDIAEDLRKILLNKRIEKLTAYSETLLFFVGREQIYERIKRYYNHFDYVLFDRSHYTTYAFQIYAKNNDVSKDLYETLLNKEFVKNEECVFFMNNSPQEIVSHTKKRYDSSGDNLESLGLDFQRRAYTGYLELFIDKQHVVYLNGWDKETHLAQMRRSLNE